MLEFLSRPVTIGGWIAYHIVCFLLIYLQRRYRLRHPRIGNTDDYLRTFYHIMAEGEKEQKKGSSDRSAESPILSKTE